MGRYHPFYCEENVWWLARDGVLGPGERWAVFVSNPTRSCALWAQKLASEPSEPVLWDYHVVLLNRDGSKVQVWDRDSRLPCPAPARDWYAATFPVPVKPEFKPWFRVVGARELSAHFASDRRHMLEEEGGWRAPPPPWPPIVSPTGAVHTLDAFVDVVGPGPGQVFDEAGFMSWMAGLGDQNGVASGP